MNKNSTVGSVSVNYGGSGGAGALSGSPDTSADLSSRRADFDVTIGGTSGQTITISASGGGVSTTTIATLTIQ